MQTYIVGGAVRDALLGLPVSDRDHVVVGATPEDMVRAGYRPVGADFPVFLHPVTHEEYALARTERKTAPGYKGFVFHTDPGVTLEEDLRRRDLTVNAMARAEDGTLIDPYGGERDLAARVLRHVSEAFREDPVRILRTARFAARFASLGFTVAEESLALMREMVAAGEVDALVPERVWQEIARGLMEATPSRMFEVLEAASALERLLPEARANAHAMALVDACAARGLPLQARFAALFVTHDDAAREGAAAGKRLKAPTECIDLAHQTQRHLPALRRAQELDAAGLLALYDGCDALRRLPRFRDLLALAATDHLVLAGTSATLAVDSWPVQNKLEGGLAALQSIDFGRIAAQGGDVPANIRKAKLAALKQFLKEI